jgi:hypothetical protein
MKSIMHSKTFESFEELLEFVRNWRIWQDPGAHEYDVGEMIRLLGACADNLSKFALDAELEDIPEFLEHEQIQFLKKLGKTLEQITERNSEID